MGRETQLDRQWRELMFLCDQEVKYRDQPDHPKLLKLVSHQIDGLAREMGFSELQIQSRDFRAERAGDHIVAVISNRDA